MKVLVTGGAGFIGRHVVNELLNRNHEVRVIDSLREDVHTNQNPTFPVGVEFRKVDVRDFDLTCDAVSKMDGVIHLAGKVGLGVDVYDLIDYTSSNDLGTATLLEAMAKQDVARITLASSMVVYGEGKAICEDHGIVSPAPRKQEDMDNKIFEPPCPLCSKSLSPMSVDEDSLLDPRNTYASSKLSQENLCASFSRLTNGTVSAMRYHNVYGPGMPKDTPYAGVASIFLSSLQNGEAPQVYEDGKQRRDFINVRDIASATVQAFEKNNETFRAFNVGSGTVRTIGDMASALSDTLAGKKPIVTGKYRLGDVRHITADSTRLMKELTWKPEVDFYDGMAELANANS